MIGRRSDIDCKDISDRLDAIEGLLEPIYSIYVVLVEIEAKIDEFARRESVKEAITKELKMINEGNKALLAHLKKINSNL